MFEDVLYPRSLKPKALDAFLAKGWFRMGQSIFTTEYVMFKACIYRTIWLRLVLKDYIETKSFLNLKKRNKHFRVEVKPVEITAAHEKLFDLYKSSIQFDAASSLHQLLNGYVYVPVQIYNTFEINIYDEDVLIACSYFDVGHRSAEGISAYYAPAYRHHSPGRYLIYLQIEACRAMGIQYYYPGYFVPGFAHLDYKLHIGPHCLEYYQTDEALWYPIQDYEDAGIPTHFQRYFSETDVRL